ncbi:unnamed protein product [Paramecium pentaurelia]|uniref:Uncharacterized protein n=1 Tax=Paramecium pentaurelia TaxID=43138 RepID=A0A8S1W8T8_9CILI|nr:unnamed protein product [Paramecium pentaurelia]
MILISAKQNDSPLNQNTFQYNQTFQQQKNNAIIKIHNDHYLMIKNQKPKFYLLKLEFVCSKKVENTLQMQIYQKEIWIRTTRMKFIENLQFQYRILLNYIFLEQIIIMYQQIIIRYSYYFIQLHLNLQLIHKKQVDTEQQNSIIFKQLKMAIQYIHQKIDRYLLGITYCKKFYPKQFQLIFHLQFRPTNYYKIQ